MNPRDPRTLKVHIISLPGSCVRRESIRNQLCAQWDNWQFFDGVCGEDGASHFNSVDEKGFFAATGRKVAPNEIGCFASHARLWQECFEGNEPIVVLEDDAALAPSFSESIRAAEKSIRRLGFVRLQDDGPRIVEQKIPVDMCAPFEFLRYFRYPYGAMGYVISPDVARVFHARSRIFSEPADSFIKRYWNHGVPLFGISPPTVTGGPLSEKTTIRGREKQFVPLRERRIRFVRKMGDTFRRAVFNSRTVS